ncbi:DUF6364 family protein [Algoriphagus sp.]|uniref:DUF6364 family protein n=1 Tax=Algoriphagus sp. TaxID=1872435 RepID=UPI003F7008E7
MDAKVTLSFDKNVIDRAKSFAEENNISLSRLTEYLYTQITSKNYKSLEDLPVSDWVDFVAEGRVEYRKPPNRKALKDKFFSSKK